MKQKIGGHPLRFMILESDFWKNVRAGPLAIDDFGIRFLEKKLEGNTPCDLRFLDQICNEKSLGGHPLRFMILGSDF